jgi:hypothetical protein
MENQDSVQIGVNQRFITVFDALRNSGAVKNKKDFCDKIGIPAQHFSDFQKNDRNVSPRLISELYNQFGVSAEYMLLNKGGMFEKKESMVVEPEPKYLTKDEMLAKLINEMEFKTKQLQRCEEEVDRLKNGRTPVYGK